MKNRNYFTISILFLVVALFIIGAVLILSKLEKLPGDDVAIRSQKAEISSVAPPIEETADDYYTIKTTKEGKIGVFYGRATEPKFLLHDILLIALPEFDRRLLEEGITVYSNEDLYKLIEDLDS